MHSIAYILLTPVFDRAICIIYFSLQRGKADGVTMLLLVMMRPRIYGETTFIGDCVTIRSLVMTICHVPDCILEIIRFCDDVMARFKH
jgi:hypothetical protein